jgi:hypothetical protein
MNLLGKLLIVLIFIGSIGLASFTVVVYATHTNWKVRADKLDQSLKEKTQELTKLQSVKDAMEAALKLEVKRQQDSVLALTGKVRQLSQDYDESRGELAGLKEELAQQVAAVKDSHETAERLRLRYDGQSKALLESTNQWMAMSTELIKKSDEAHTLAVQLTTYQSTAAQLAKDYRDAMEVLRLHDLSPDPALYSKRPPIGIQGTVTEVRPRGNVEISIGADSGLVKGHQLDVVRNVDGRSVYIGKIEIVNTAADRAVAQVMPEFRKGVVQRGDEVTYIEVNELVAH